MLVDDNEFNLVTLKEVLEQKFKLKCDTATNGQIAVDMVNSRLDNPYKLIFMDCMMPIMDGFDATIAIRQIYSNLDLESNEQPLIVALSAVTRKEDIKRCLSVGMNSFSKI